MLYQGTSTSNGSFTNQKWRLEHRHRHVRLAGYESFTATLNYEADYQERPLHLHHRDSYDLTRSSSHNLTGTRSRSTSYREAGSYAGGAYSMSSVVYSGSESGTSNDTIYSYECMSGSGGSSNEGDSLGSSTSADPADAYERTRSGDSAGGSTYTFTYLRSGLSLSARVQKRGLLRGGHVQPGQVQPALRGLSATTAGGMTRVRTNSNVTRAQKLLVPR